MTTPDTKPAATESVSKVDFLTPKAFHNSAQGNTLGLGRAFEPTLKALNNDRMQNPQENERIFKPLQGNKSFGNL
jgi:hypothetical protein